MPTNITTVQNGNNTTVFSTPGAIVGGLVVGLLRAISVAVLGPRWAMASVFLVLIVFLAFRPQGIYGKSKTRAGQR